MKNLKIATYNLRCVYNKDGINSFIHRAVLAADKIEDEKPDVIGFQEITPKNLTVMEKLLPEYSFVGQFRSASFDTEGLYVAVRKESCMLLGFESVWLSPTPYVPGSRFEDQSHCPRICVQAKIRHIESGKIFRVFNIHLDHISESARVLGISSVFEFIDSFNDGAPIALLGDFNAHPDSDTVALCNARKGLRDVTANIPTTFHNYGKTSEKIDYIYLSGELADSVAEVNAWTDEINGIYLSDHYPVCAEIVI